MGVILHRIDSDLDSLQSLGRIITTNLAGAAYFELLRYAMCVTAGAAVTRWCQVPVPGHHAAAPCQLHTQIHTAHCRDAHKRFGN